MLSQLGKFISAFVLTGLVMPNIASAKIKVEGPNFLEAMGLECQKFLREPQILAEEKLHLMSAFNRFRFGRQKNFGGFYFETKKPNKYSQVRKVDLVFPEDPFWKTEKWSLSTEQVRFLNIGFENLAAESRRMNKLVSDHILEHPNDSLLLNFSTHRSLDEKVLTNIRWHIHDAVLETYTRKKKYLSGEDLRQLIAYSHESTHNDVLALMSSLAKPIELMTYEELGRELLMTIQISYFGTRNYIEPSLRGVLAANGLDVDEGNDRLPFEYRIPKDKLNSFRRQFYKRFHAVTTCEINRYVKFGKIEGAMQDYFLLSAIMTARNRGMRTIIASADGLTSKIFSRYGFKQYSNLPGQEGEVILYLETDSQEFQEFFNSLAIGSENVKVD